MKQRRIWSIVAIALGVIGLLFIFVGFMSGNGLFIFVGIAEIVGGYFLLKPSKKSSSTSNQTGIVNDEKNT